MPLSTKDTYDSKIIPLVSITDQRNYLGTVDDIMINFIPEVVKTAESSYVDLIKRDGSETIIATTGTGVVRGVYSWDYAAKLYVVIGQDIYIYDQAFTLVTTLLAAFSAGTTQIGFTEFLYEDGTSVLICTDGTTLNRITTANAITSSGTVAGVVGSHVATPVYYDGYLLLVKSGTGDCYNSDLDDPMTWTAGNFITAEINPDTVRNITRINNYFILLGDKSFEYFYDVGNPTGTPFARNDVFVKNIGYVNNTAAPYGNKIFLVGNKLGATPEAFVLEDFTTKPISTPAIKRWLASVTTQTLRGNLLSINGHDLYVLSDGTRCYYYDASSELWGRLTYKSSSTNFPIKYTTLITSSYGQQTIFTTTDDNAVLRFSSILYQDGGVSFPCIVRTNVLDFGTNNNKFMSSLSVMSDRASSGSIDIEASDNDYQTYTTARSLSLNQERPTLKQWGRFRRRAFRLTYTTDNSLRLKGLEVAINQGIT